MRHGWIARWELRDVLSCARNGLETRTVDLGHDRDGNTMPNAIIPSVAIHMNLPLTIARPIIPQWTWYPLAGTAADAGDLPERVVAGGGRRSGGSSDL